MRGSSGASGSRRSALLIPMRGNEGNEALLVNNVGPELLIPMRGNEARQTRRGETIHHLVTDPHEG